MNSRLTPRTPPSTTSRLLASASQNSQCVLHDAASNALPAHAVSNALPVQEGLQLFKGGIDKATATATIHAVVDQFREGGKDILAAVRS